MNKKKLLKQIKQAVIIFIIAFIIFLLLGLVFKLANNLILAEKTINQQSSQINQLQSEFNHLQKENQAQTETIKYLYKKQQTTSVKQPVVYNVHEKDTTKEKTFNAPDLNPMPVIIITLMTLLRSVVTVPAF